MAENKDKNAIQFLGRNCIWGTTIVNIFLFDLFFIIKETDFSSYANDNKPYRTRDTTGEAMKLLERNSVMLIKQFSDNQMNAIISKCNFLVNKKNEVLINLRETRYQFFMEVTVYPTQSENLGYCTFRAERVKQSECFQKGIKNGNRKIVFAGYISNSIKSRFHY